MNVKKAKLIDMAILTVLAVIADVLVYLTANIGGKSYAGFFYLAPSMCILLFIYARWKYAGVISHAIFLIVQVILYRNQIFIGYQIAIPFILGYVALVLYVPIAHSKWFGFEKLVKKIVPFIMVYAISITLEMATGLILQSGIAIDAYFYRHLINILVCFFLFLVASLQKRFLMPIEAYMNQLSSKDLDS